MVATMMGMLCHRFKSKSYQKGVLLFEHADLTEGGRWKSSFLESLSHIIGITSVDGKELKQADKNKWEGVSLDAGVVLIDDLPHYKSLDFLNNIVTGTFEICGKYRPQTKLRYVESPRIAITTNKHQRGMSDTIGRRFISVPVYRFFHGENTPKQHFKHQLFEDWKKKEEWDRYFVFMANCIQAYLKNKCEIKEDATARSNAQEEKLQSTLETCLVCKRGANPDELFEHLEREYLSVYRNRDIKPKVLMMTGFNKAVEQVVSSIDDPYRQKRVSDAGSGMRFHQKNDIAGMVMNYIIKKHGGNPKCVEIAKPFDSRRFYFLFNGAKLDDEDRRGVGEKASDLADDLINGNVPTPNEIQEEKLRKIKEAGKKRTKPRIGSAENPRECDEDAPLA